MESREEKAMWWTRNEHGFWCSFCGENLMPSSHFDDDEERDEYEAKLDERNCPNCGAPDEFDPDKI